jgi:hypothetical protein
MVSLITHQCASSLALPHTTMYAQLGCVSTYAFSCAWTLNAYCVIPATWYILFGQRVPGMSHTYL